MHDPQRESSASTSVGHLYVRSYYEGVYMPGHNHSKARFSFVLSGCFYEKIGRLERDTDVTAVHFHPVDEEHATRFLAPETRTLKVELNDRATHLLSEAALQPSKTASLMSAHALRLCSRIARLVESDDRYKSFALESLCYELLAEMGHARKAETGAADFLLLRARDYLAENLPGKGAVESAAREVGMHPFSFIRAFGGRFGVSPGEYLRRARLQKAMELLADGGLALAEVALLCGYSDQSHMSRAVKAATGQSPAGLRASRVQRG